MCANEHTLIEARMHCILAKGNRRADYSIAAEDEPTH